MADLFVPLTPPNLGAAPKRCRRHVWEWAPVKDMVACCRCGKPKDEALARRGRSARRLGSDQERRIERRYGPVKIGERGDPVDHLGRDWRWQSKATRSAPPLWLAAITNAEFRATVPVVISQCVSRMAGHYEDRRPLVIRSYVHQGLRTQDWIFVRGQDLLTLHGAWWVDHGWYVFTGEAWLDEFGTDRPAEAA